MFTQTTHKQTSRRHWFLSGLALCELLVTLPPPYHVKRPRKRIVHRTIHIESVVAVLPARRQAASIIGPLLAGRW